MIGLETLTVNVWRHWQSELPAEIPTVYPGQRVNTNGWTRWVELWVSAWDREASRAGTHLGEVLVTLHVYSRGREKPLEVAEVVDEARRVLERRTIAIPFGSETPTGYVRFREFEVEDLSRRDAEGWGRGWRHVVVRCGGELVEVGSE
jgi:hypothetical protein